jgi:hypothetical protein
MVYRVVLAKTSHEGKAVPNFIAQLSKIKALGSDE